MRDPFDVLGLPPTATWPEIEAAYNQLVRALHPDLHMAQPEHIRKQMSDRMAEVTGALTLLKDKQAYARWRSRQRATSPPEPGPSDASFDYREAAKSEFDVPSRQWDYAHRIRPEDVVRPAAHDRATSAPRRAKAGGPHGGRNGPSTATVITVVLGAVIVGAIVGFGLAVEPAESEVAAVIDQRIAAFAGGTTPASNLAVGVCFDSTVVDVDDDGHGRVQAVAKRNCSDPHEAEVYGQVDLRPLTDAGYPGRSAITAYTDPVCDELFAKYVDQTRWPRSILSTGIIYPSAESWPQGDRTAFCRVGATNGGRLEVSVRTDRTGP